jgi:hypothetical protein
MAIFHTFALRNIKAAAPPQVERNDLPRLRAHGEFPWRIMH